MHTFIHGDWSISYNSDLSGEAVIDSSGKVNGALCRFNRASVPAELLKAFAEQLVHDTAGPAYKRMAESEINRLTERAEAAEKELAKATSLCASLAAERDELRDELDRTYVFRREHFPGYFDYGDKAEVAHALESEKVRSHEFMLEAEDARRALVSAKAELEELRAKATPSDELLSFASMGYYVGPLAQKACEFILSLAPAPKRKTRLDVYVEGWIADGGEYDSSMLESVRREGIAQLKRQKLDPGEEI